MSAPLLRLQDLRPTPDRRPRRPWDVRLRQWLLREACTYWGLVALFAALSALLCWLAGQ